MIKSLTVISGSKIQKSLRRSKKRKQDSLFFSLPCLLVSDKASTNYYDANMGVTLPSSRNATNNIGLSPLFASRNGHSIEWQNDWKYNLTGRGLGGYLWSKTTRSNGYVYYLEFGQDNILPSRNERSLYVFSLRCLVSTNNG